MPGRVAEALRRSSPLIDEILGNRDDIRVKKNLAEAYAELKPYEQEYNDQQKFRKMSQQVYSVKLDNTDKVKQVPDWNITGNDESLGKTNALTKFKEYLDTPEAKTSGAGYDNVSLKKYLTDNPEHMAELQAQNLVSPTTRLEAVTNDELKARIYQKAGFTPEDMQFYDSRKSKAPNSDEHNNRLLNMIYGKHADLVSRGGLKSSLWDLYGKRAERLAMTTPKFGFQKIGDKLYKYDDQGNMELVDGGEKEKTIQDIRSMSDNDLINSTPEQLKSYYSVLNGKQKQLAKELYPSLEGTTDMADLTAEQLGKLSYDDLVKKYSTKEIYGIIEDVAPDVRAKLYEKYPEWKPDPTKSRTGRTGRRSSSLNTSIDSKVLKSNIDYLSKTEIKNKGKTPDDKTKKAYTDKFNQVKQQTGLSDKIIHEILDDYKKTGKLPKDLIKSTERLSVEQEVKKKIIDSVYYDDKLAQGGTQSLFDWSRTFDGAPNLTTLQDVVRKWDDRLKILADEVGISDEEYNQIYNDAHGYFNDLAKKFTQKNIKSFLNQ